MLLSLLLAGFFFNRRLAGSVGPCSSGGSLFKRSARAARRLAPCSRSGLDRSASASFLISQQRARCRDIVFFNRAAGASGSCSRFLLERRSAGASLIFVLSVRVLVFYRLARSAGRRVRVPGPCPNGVARFGSLLSFDHRFVCFRPSARELGVVLVGWP